MFFGNTRIAITKFIFVVFAELSNSKVSTCKVELEADKMQLISVSSQQGSPPPLTVMTLAARIIRSDITKHDEVSVIYCRTG